MSVCVIEICWCWLFENLWGYFNFVILFKLICLSRLLMICWVLFLFCVNLWKWIGLVIMLKIFICGFIEVYGFWNIICIWWCSGWCLCFDFSVVKLMFLKVICFVLGWYKLVIMCVMVDLFEFDLLIRLKVFFLCIVKLMLFDVCIYLWWFLNSEFLVIKCRLMFLIFNSGFVYLWWFWFCFN